MNIPSRTRATSPAAHRPSFSRPATLRRSAREARMFNSFGHLFRVTTWGESHGPALGCVIDGCPPGIPLDRGSDPALARRPPPRPEPLHHPAPGGRPGRDPLRHLRGGDDRDPDLAPDPQHRPAVQGLFRDRGEVPPRPRRPHLPPEVRAARLPRRRPLLGARDRRPRRRRRRRPRRPRPARAAGPHPRRAGADGRPHDRPRRLGLGRAAAQPLLVPRPQGRRDLGRLSRRPAQVRQLGRRHRRAGRRGRSSPASARRSTPSSTATSPWR